MNNLPLHIKPLNTEGEKGSFNVEANTGKVVTLDSTITNAFGYYYFKDGWTGEESKQDIIDKCKILFIEYQEGMENWDIPYFEGMQSVKMPVLTTTNVDGTKTNILTTSEEVELRGIGDVQDEMDLTTGEVIENLIEVSINSETEINGYSQTIGSNSNTSRFMVHIKNTFGIDVENGYGLSDKIPYMNNDSDVFHFRIGNAKNACFIYVPISELKTNDWKGFVEWAKNKDFKLLLKRTEKYIKTVDLSVVNQDGEILNKIKPIEGTMHIKVSGTPLNPTAVLEVPVEAITQNLASFIETEE